MATVTTSDRSFFFANGTICYAKRGNAAGKLRRGDVIKVNFRYVYYIYKKKVE